MIVGYQVIACADCRHPFRAALYERPNRAVYPYRRCTFCDAERNRKLRAKRGQNSKYRGGGWRLVSNRVKAHIDSRRPKQPVFVKGYLPKRPEQFPQGWSHMDAANYSNQMKRFATAPTFDAPEPASTDYKADATSLIGLLEAAIRQAKIHSEQITRLVTENMQLRATIKKDEERPNANE